jgi:hypothetical protein
VLDHRITLNLGTRFRPLAVGGQCRLCGIGLANPSNRFLAERPSLVTEDSTKSSMQERVPGN